MAEVELNALICGGGNGAHTMAGLAASKPNVNTRVLTLFADEAERWTKTLEKDDMELSATYIDGTQGKIRSKPYLITKDPAKAMANVDIIICVVPAFAHQQYFDSISQHIPPNTVIVGMPGQAGFEIQCIHTLKDKAKQCAILNVESLPWNCRIKEFGKKVEILGFKETMGTSVIEGHGKYKQSPLEMLQRVLGKNPVLKKFKNYIALNLMTKSIVHPPIMYGRWKDWDGKPLNEKPLFYQGVDDLQSDLLSEIGNELINVGKEFQRRRPDLDMSEVVHVTAWLMYFYQDQITDSSSLQMMMKTNKAYDGLVHPMKEQGGGFVPDFGYRYTVEDIPFGLVTLKGFAEIAGVPTPTIDKIVAWAQTKLDKVFIEGSSLTGKDVKLSRAPQAFEITTLDQLCDIL